MRAARYGASWTKRARRIEALVAEANGPLREIPAALTASSSAAEPPIPTLETILGADPLARGSGPSVGPSKLESGPFRIESVPRNDRSDDRGSGDSRSEGHSAPWRQSGEPRAAVSTPEPFAGGGVSSNLALSTPVPALSEPVPAPVAAGGHVASAAGTGRGFAHPRVPRLRRRDVLRRGAARCPAVPRALRDRRVGGRAAVWLCRIRTDSERTRPIVTSPTTTRAPSRVLRGCG